jgi:hypothetical protein
MPYFASRATGQTGGKMKCKCNAMQVVVMVVTFYFMDFAMCRVLQLLKYVYLMALSVTDI